MGYRIPQYLVIGLIWLSFLNNAYAGVTSTFVRSEWPSVDIPLDNEVFAVPKGYNAPEQVSFWFQSICWQVFMLVDCVW